MLILYSRVPTGNVMEVHPPEPDSIPGIVLGFGAMWYRVPNKWSIDKKTVLIGIDCRL